MITAICDLYAKRYYITINYILYTVHFICMIHLFHKNSVSLNLPYLFLFSPKPPPLQQSSICSQRLGCWLKTQFNSILKSRDITLPTKVCLVKVMVSAVVMYGCESWTIKKAWVPKNWCCWTTALEKTLENPLDIKEIQPFHLKGNQSWIFIGRTDVEADPIFWPPDVKSWLIWKDPDAGKDWM